MAGPVFDSTGKLVASNPFGADSGTGPSAPFPGVAPASSSSSSSADPSKGAQTAPFATTTAGFNGNGGGSPAYGTQSPSAFGTGQYVAPLLPINDQAITGAPTQGASTNYGLNSVWSNLSNELAAAPSQGAGMQVAATAAPASYGAATGTAAQAQAAGSGNVGISTAGDAAFQAQQQALASQLATQAAGGGMSPADLQLKQGQEAAVAQQLAVLGSQRGGTNAALAQRSAADQAMAQEAATNQAAGIQRATETLNAQNAEGSVLGTARGQAQGYNEAQAGLTQQTALANAGNVQQTALANAQATNAMTSGNLAAENAANTGNAQLQQQASLAAAASKNTAQAQNQSTELANAQLLAQQQAAITGAQTGIANANKASSLADQQLQLQQMIAANQINEQGFASAAQANANLTGAVISGGTTLLGQGVSALKGSGSSGSSSSSGGDETTYVDGSTQTVDPTYWQNLHATSDENLKTGIEGGNPMLRSFLSSYRDSMAQPSAPKIDVNEGAGFRNPTYGKTASGAGSGSGIGGGIGAILGGILGSVVAPGIGTAIGSAAGGAIGSAAGGAISPGSPGSSVQTSNGSGVTVDESGWGQMPDAMTATSDEKEKDAVTSGNRGIQAFLQQANAQTNAQNNGGAGSNAFMQVGMPPSAAFDTQMPPSSVNQGYGAPPPPWMSGQTFGGGVSGGGVAQQGGYTGGSSSAGALSSGPSNGGPQFVQPSQVPGLAPTSGTPFNSNPVYVGTTPAATPYTPMHSLLPFTVNRPAAALPSTPPPSTGVLSALNGAAWGATLSDEREKTKMPWDVDASASKPLPLIPGLVADGTPSGATPTPTNRRGVQNMLDELEAQSYRYKDPSAPGAMPGTRLGVMAQDLLKSPLGAQFVEKGPDGALKVNYGQMAGTQLAASAMLNERLDKHEAMINSLAERDQ